MKSASSSLRFTVCVSLALAAACNKGDDATQTATLKPVPAPASHAQMQPTALPDPEAEGQMGTVGRAPRRLTVAQLRQSIVVATGREWAGLNTVANSLGRADYALVNAEGTEANLVFAKFLEDGARDVCRNTATADSRVMNPAERVLSREIPNGANLGTIDDATAQKNLVYLSTRFWGQPLAGAELSQWTQTFKAMGARAQMVNKRDDALAAICVALMTDARFVTY